MRVEKLAVMVSALLTVEAAYGATFTVPNTLDGGPGSFSNAIAQANAGTGIDCQCLD
jgi:hypothetical protein